MIRDAYEQAAAIIVARGQRAESIEVAHEVERLRLRWRPANVRIVVLAESHVWTSENEANSRVLQPDGIETGFARLVYCLGYGEPSLVQAPSLMPIVPPNRGTWQYWRLFHDAVRGPDTPHDEIRQPNRTRRALAKLQLLNELKLAGIWLVDASVTALYKPPSTRLVSGSDYKKLLRASWFAYVRDMIVGCQASAVLIIGQAVNDAIGDLVRQVAHKTEIVVVNQPNARMTRDMICNNRHKIFDLCRRHLAVVDDACL